MADETPPGYWNPERSCHTKNRYSTIVFAKQIADKVYASRKEKVQPYHCEYCYGFHLTKHEKIWSPTPCLK